MKNITTLINKYDKKLCKIEDEFWKKHSELEEQLKAELGAEEVEFVWEIMCENRAIGIKVIFKDGFKFYRRKDG